MTASPPEIGTTIAGRYTLIELLGSGGMGAVYRARQLNLDREVALKLVHARLLDDDEDDSALRRFEREARVAAALRHPNVIEIYDIGESEGVAYLAMELLRGENLRRRLRTIAGPAPLAMVREVGLPLAEALVAAHAIGAVHRDLKPENVFLEDLPKGERVVILDFGLAFIAEDAQSGRMTQQGVVVGTPDYLSPEQARGREVGPASDVYSLGCILYELLTGRPPFVARRAVLMLTKHAHETPMHPSQWHPGVPRKLDEFVMRMLRKRPEQRPEPGEVAAVLEAIDGGGSTRARSGVASARVPSTRSQRMISVDGRALGPNAVGGNELGKTMAAPAPRPNGLARTRALTQTPAGESPAEDPPPTPTLEELATNPTVRAHATSEIPTAPLHALDVDGTALILVGELDEEDELGLRSNDFVLLPWSGEGSAPTEAQLLFLVDASDSGRVQACVATGLPVVAAVRSDDRQTLGELARLGVSELTTLPIDTDSAVRSLRRALRRARRRARQRP
ncbi:serine/threonine protein kinase [Plesiocystis pacifica SIR-1]|uniref:Serine/threonine protein kinase n=1 Tax=Plesiocystis pacifica SIR-1 TaxID=391625 RepID=A6GEM6_9BACT|nr:serine/threonine-protein kinase [Plesiocystis pacifica]EDM75672.1 serine/threonine protein kinase [Plesiocystis pacifica SIR-1]